MKILFVLVKLKLRHCDLWSLLSTLMASDLIGFSYLTGSSSTQADLSSSVQVSFMGSHLWPSCQHWTFKIIVFSIGKEARRKPKRLILLNQILKCYALKDNLKKMKTQQAEWRKYLQIMYLIKMYLEYTYKHNSIIKRQITQFKNEWRIWINISVSKIYAWPISPWEDAHHISHWGNVNQNLSERDSYTLGWLGSKSQIITSVDNDVDKLELSYAARGKQKHCI